MEFIEAVRIIHPVKPTDDYIDRDYNMNIYRGCCHGCVYCDSRSLCYQIDRFDTVRAKQNALQMIEGELKQKRRRGIIATGAMSDPYTPFERDLLLTRGALELIARYRFGVSLTTKSPLAARDADIYKEIAAHALADVRLTITAADDGLAKKLEPNVAPSSERFAALEALSAAGVHTGVFITPVLPYITDTMENIRTIVKRAADCGATDVVCMMGMTLRAGNREYYYAALEREFPGIKQKYIAAFGDRYMCPSPRAKELYAAFRDACEAHRLLYTFKSINRAMRSLMDRQVSFFDM